ncbi:MAG: DNA cytosine methyltransferase, partial [Chitinophagales bacterium]|nr:DNA cytosine methyltransferase [Hyphomicrobiales bacterium]
MARAGLGDGWECLFANDFSPMKAAAYAANWGGEHLVCSDIATVKASDLPGKADLAWASFPCQDLSLAGGQKGLGRTKSTTATRSGTFWAFWGLIKRLKREKRGPRMIVLENVCGVLTSSNGEDFAAICAALAGASYRFGAVVIDAKLFVPQSRQRVFFIAVEAGAAIPAGLVADAANAPWYPKTLIAAQARLTAAAQKKWVWWNLDKPALRQVVFADLIEQKPKDVKWHTNLETERILAMMSPVNLAKVGAALASGKKCVGAVYKRIRKDASGHKQQRAEVRFDDVAGCLRTPGGGSSRQTILMVE